jgi:LacI family transcriptional regulator
MSDFSTAFPAPRRRPKMRDVAALAGVSLSTVSRVVNGTPVDPVLAARVQEAIQILGYQPNAAASDLRRTTPKTTTVGLIVADVGNPFFSQAHRGVEEVLRTRGTLSFAASSDEEPERERRIIEALAARDVSGLIVVPTDGDHGYLARLRDRGLPIVFMDRPAARMDADVVSADNAGAACQACEHLIEHGHRRIAMLGNRLGLDAGPIVYTTVERFNGYRQALERYRIPYDPALVRDLLMGSEAVESALRGLLSLPDPPTAIFTSHNMITIHAVRAQRALGVTQSLALVGFDDVDMAEHADPPITVIAQEPRSIGRRAAVLLVARMDGDRGPHRHVLVPTRLIARGSGELRPRRT